MASRWRSLSDPAKAPYLDQEAAEKSRFAQESAAADAAAADVVEARRAALTVQEGEAAGSRGARQRIDAERAHKEDAAAGRRMALKANLDPEEAAERERAAAHKRHETKQRREKKRLAEEAVQKQHTKLDKESSKKAESRLDYLLAQSSIFAKLRGGGGALPTGKEVASPERKQRAAAAAKSKSVHHLHSRDSNDSANDSDEAEEEEAHMFLTKQPECIKFGNLKGYQLEGLNWMIHLAEKGLNGILADEMGLGKTLQSISIMAYHWEFLKQQGPHLICVPKSTLSNWMNELKRWCPSLRAIKFHGSREDREYMVDNFFTNAAAAHDGKRPTLPQIMNNAGELIDDNSENPRTWDVCVTTYEVANAERKTLLKFTWKYLVIDEAHRLKNDASLFSKTVRSFRTANRLLLTG